MTSLNKPVRRKTRWSYSVLYAHDSRPIVVSLEPGDVVTFREAGRRHVWSVPVDRMFRQAVREAALAEHRARRQKA
jgi:hypothetical protein